MNNDDRDGWKRLQKIDSREIKKRFKKASGDSAKHANKFLVKRWASVRESQFQITKWIFFMGILIAATGLQLMWYQNNYKTTTKATDGIYPEAALGPVSTLNPIFASTSAERSTKSLIFSSLLRYDTSGNLGYDIVKNLVSDESKTKYTITIRSDIKWHDGTSLSANDVIFTINLIKNPNVRSTIDGWNDVTAKLINDSTIELKTRALNVGFEHLLTFPILPAHILNSIEPANIRENNFSQSPVGSGPFKVSFVQEVEEKEGQQVIFMTRNNDYYGGSPKINRFQLHAYSTTDGIRKALSTNEVNAAADLSADDVSKIEKNKYVILSKPIKSGAYAILNTKSEILQDINMRKALQLATDTNAILQGLGTTLPSLGLPFIDGQLNGDVPVAADFDLEGAKKILDDNGWVIGDGGTRVKDGVKLSLSVVVVKDSMLEKTLEKLVEQWAKLGISISNKIVDPADITQNVAQEILRPRNFDVLLYVMNIGADPDVYAYWHSSQATDSGLNLSNYSNQVSDDALSSARSRTEPELRNAKYLTFARQWLRDVPAIGLYQRTVHYAHIKDIVSFNGANNLISSVDRYSDILDWSVGKREVYKTP